MMVVTYMMPLFKHEEYFEGICTYRGHILEQDRALIEVEGDHEGDYIWCDEEKDYIWIEYVLYLIINILFAYIATYTAYLYMRYKGL